MLTTFYCTHFQFQFQFLGFLIQTVGLRHLLSVSLFAHCIGVPHFQWSVTRVTIEVGLKSLFQETQQSVGAEKSVFCKALALWPFCSKHNNAMQDILFLWSAAMCEPNCQNIFLILSRVYHSKGLLWIMTRRRLRRLRKRQRVLIVNVNSLHGQYQLTPLPGNS